MSDAESTSWAEGPDPGPAQPAPDRNLGAAASGLDVLHEIVPDLLGHGESAKPRGDYSLGAYASGVRDLLIALGHERATFVGHSLGGGVAMQLAYQFPEQCERLVLVSSGGWVARSRRCCGLPAFRARS
jgi:pimeloyl-ACP methyl ester carboxylesterase